ncbi:MAG: hypothetical protein U9N34_04710 [Candidatus Cloacimonadota bacterium]|nr:hypothetical protein [Candidatus Cloacimonadota bacterium]
MSNNIAITQRKMKDYPMDELYRGYKFESVLDLGMLLSDEVKMHHFFKFFMDQLNKYDDKYHLNKVDMVPFVEHNTKFVNYIVTDYNYLVLILAKYIDTNNLGDGNHFIDLFKAEGTKENQRRVNGITNNLYLLSIFESFWKIAYVNGSNLQRKYSNYSTPAIYKNERTAIQFGSIMFVTEALEKLINDDYIFNELEEISQSSKAEQVAFSNSTKMKFGINCADWWKKNSTDFKKKMFFESDGLKV